MAMAFDRSPQESVVFQTIVKACAKYGLEANRVDQKFDSGPINIQVVDAIEDSEFLVFDLTEERPNVYYELGYAHGVGNRPEDVILIAANGTKLHFDIMPLRTVFYDSPEDLENKLFVRLGNLIAFHRRIENAKPISLADS